MLELRCAVSTSDELLVGDCAFIGCSGSYDLGSLYKLQHGMHGCVL